MKNRYKNNSQVTQVFLDLPDVGTVSVVPGGTVVADEKSAVARHPHMVLVQKNVREREGEAPEFEAPQHSGETPLRTATVEAKGYTDTVLTDEFDGGSQGAVNTSAAPLTAPEEPQSDKVPTSGSDVETVEKAKRTRK